ncbi:hypothetical protein VTK56DRAFT_3255 [Thermocarpiscus australiensis]
MGSYGPQESLRVIVIGAGSAGLLMGQVFKKAGIDVTVFEKDESPYARPRDWNFGVYWAQSRIEECLTPELNAWVDTVQTDPSYRRVPESVCPIYHGGTGKILKNAPAPNAIRLRRRAWLDLIRTGVDVRYAKKLAAISTSGPGVTALFEDGTVEHGDLLIGADGAHSVTRQWLFQSSPQEAALQEVPISYFATLCKLGREMALAVREIHPTYSMTMNPNGLFTFVSLHDCTPPDPADWVFMFVLTWSSEQDDEDQAAALSRDSKLLIDYIHARAKPLVYPYRDMLRAIPRDARAWYGRTMTSWPTRPWDGRGGRVTLAGDAAHPMTFHRGQGLGNAIADVAELQTRLRAMRAHTREELARAVGEYEKEVWARGSEVVMQNMENTLALHDWERITQSAMFVKGVTK